MRGLSGCRSSQEASQDGWRRPASHYPELGESLFAARRAIETGKRWLTRHQAGPGFLFALAAGASV
jgi:hypothetical protein